MDTPLYEQIPPRLRRGIGLDVAKQSFDAAVLRPAQPRPTRGRGKSAFLRDIPVHRFARNRQGITECMQWVHSVIGDGVQAECLHVCMEAITPKA